MAAELGVRAGRLPVVAVGASDPPVVVGGVKSGVVSDSGDCTGESGFGIEEAAQIKRKKVWIYH